MFSKKRKFNAWQRPKTIVQLIQKIGETIKNHKRVILYGLNDAKVDLLDLVSGDKHFLKIEFENKDIDKMTVNQQHNFVKEYFSKA